MKTRAGLCKDGDREGVLEGLRRQKAGHRTAPRLHRGRVRSRGCQDDGILCQRNGRCSRLRWWRGYGKK